MTNLLNIDANTVAAQATNAANTAKDAYLAKWKEATGGNEYGEPMYCGFASVKIRPARGAFVKFLKAHDIGSNAYRGGWDISYYKFMDGHPNSHTQSLDLKEIACDAFANVLKQHGMTAYGIGRAD